MLLLVIAAEPLGPPLRLDAWSIRPPSEFRRVREELVRGSGAFAIGAPPGGKGAVVALVDGEGSDAASLTFVVVESPFELGPGARDDWALQVTQAFKDDGHLAYRSDRPQAFALERSEVVAGPTPHVEVHGTVRDDGSPRRVLVVAYPGSPHHVVAVASVPPTRFSGLEGRLRASLEAVRLERPSSAGPRTVAWVVLALAGAALLGSVGLWRRRLLGLATRR